MSARLGCDPAASYVTGDLYRHFTVDGEALEHCRAVPYPHREVADGEFLYGGCGEVGDLLLADLRVPCSSEIVEQDISPSPRTQYDVISG